MSDRALFAAFQKVKAAVDDAVSKTKKKEEELRAAEEAKKAEKKARVMKAKEKKAEAVMPTAGSVSASAFSASGGFGEALASAARSSGATFRMAGKKPAGPKVVDVMERLPGKTSAPAPRTPSSGESRREGARTTKGAPDPRSSRRPERDRRTPREVRQASADTPKAAARQQTEAAQPRRPRLSYEERRTPVPPFSLMPGLPVSERGEEVARAIRDNQVVIVCGETGSGKTTQLPKIAMMAGRGTHGMIAHTQPRRIAASSIAKRIA